jgi:NitT/TauT family transport system permease protein
VELRSRRYSPDERRRNNRLKLHGCAAVSRLCLAQAACCPVSKLLGQFCFEMTRLFSRKSRFIHRFNARQAFLVPASLIIAIIAWEVGARLAGYPAFILPTPSLVLKKLWVVLQDGSLLRHSAVTLSEVIIGLVVGVSVSTSLGYLLAKSRTVERFLSPYIIASQSVPVVAIAPLLVIWFGPGLFSKVLICALIVFFPVLVNTMVGLHSVPDDLRDLMRSLQATRWQTFYVLEVPSALPVFFGGLRIGATLSVIGAVVGEFVGADRGLGFMINRARGQYDTALVFVAVLALVVLAMILYGMVVLLEASFLGWREQGSNESSK